MMHLEQAWDIQIEDAVLRLTRPQIADFAYWYATVDTVEAGYDPATNKPITRTALDEWVKRCKTNPQEEDNPAHDPTHKSRLVRPSDIVFSDTPEGTNR